VGNYLAELRSALSHFHDLAYLENHPLARKLSLVAQAPDLSRGQLLRRMLHLAIDALDPGPGTPPSAPEARPYQLLRGRYILQQSMIELASQLNISRRQAYRDLRRALEALAQILRDSEITEGPFSSHEALPSAMARVRAEVSRLQSVSQQNVDLVELVSQAIQSAQRLGQDRGVEIQFLPEAERVPILVNRVMLRQAILNLLSHIVQAHRGASPPLVRLSRAGGVAKLRFRYVPERFPEDTLPEHPYGVALQLLDSMGCEWQSQGLPQGGVEMTISFPLVRVRRLLIIDDNKGLIRLFERYLEGHPYQVYGATQASEALELITQVKPDMVILDVMMPNQDGWEVLEALRRTEEGRRALVIICSIINDPQFAFALGADGFLHKPVDRVTLLQTLARLSSKA